MLEAILSVVFSSPPSVCLPWNPSLKGHLSSSQSYTAPVYRGIVSGSQDSHSFQPTTESPSRSGPHPIPSWLPSWSSFPLRTYSSATTQSQGELLATHASEVASQGVGHLPPSPKSYTAPVYRGFVSGGSNLNSTSDTILIQPPGSQISHSFQPTTVLPSTTICIECRMEAVHECHEDGSEQVQRLAAEEHFRRNPGRPEISYML